MTVQLPLGWTTFQGGGGDPTLCGEIPCDTPPCPIPPIILTPNKPQLACTFGAEDHHLIITISGGVPPFVWISTAGVLTITGLRTAEITIHPTVPQVASEIAFFRPLALNTFLICGDSSVCTDNASVDPANSTSADVAVDVRLSPYDCLGIHMEPPGYPTVTTGPTGGPLVQTDNLFPDYTGAFYAHPIGTVVADRTCTISTNFPGQQVSNIPSDALHWSVDAGNCMTPGEAGSGLTAAVTVSANVAGKSGVHGTIWAGAPNFNESKFIPIQFNGDVHEPPCFEDSLDTAVTSFDNYIDVRSQSQVDAGCCVVPPGTALVITVTDAEGSTAVIVIPVV